MNSTEIKRTLSSRHWTSTILPALHDYIRIPNQSPLFDPDWKQQRPHARAPSLWRRRGSKSSRSKACASKCTSSKGRTPLIFMEVDGDASSTVLMYGHLDKQPAMVGWEDGLGPWTPVLRDGKLYGRGGADDGYAIFAAIAAIRALKAAERAALARSSSSSNAARRADRSICPRTSICCPTAIGTPRLVICLDSGCGNYDQLWMTTSLRGSIVGNLTRRGAHRGRALRRRQRHRAVELPHHAHPPRSPRRRADRPHHPRVAARRGSAGSHGRSAGRPRAILGDEIYNKFPFLAGHAADGERSGRAAAQPHLAADAVVHRPGRASRSRAGRQRAASEDVAQAFAARSADARRHESRRQVEETARKRSAVRRARHVRARERRRRMGSAESAAVAGEVDRRRVAERSSASRPRHGAKAARFRSWACSASASRTRSS